jgi:hypothetical protein
VIIREHDPDRSVETLYGRGIGRVIGGVRYPRL